MFERLYFHEVFVHLTFNYCAIFEQEVPKLESVKIWQNSQENFCTSTGVLL